VVNGVVTLEAHFEVTHPSRTRGRWWSTKHLPSVYGDAVFEGPPAIT
jgi:hypothetical protein